jgi:SAM-dependent methyltransferase
MERFDSLAIETTGCKLRRHLRGVSFASMPRKKIAAAIHPFDTLHGTDTSGLIPGKTIAEGTGVKVAELTAYYGVAPSILRGLLDRWLQELHPQAAIGQTVFLDVGAGKGRACLLASEYPFLRVEGVELNGPLAGVARANLALWGDDPEANALAPVEVFHADATVHPVPKEATLAFLFHPFELPILRRFLRHVEESRAGDAGPLDLIYANAEHDSLLDHHGAFERIWMGRVAMTPEDHVADLAAIAEQKEYGSTGDELCGVYRFVGRGGKAGAKAPLAGRLIRAAKAPR